MTLPTTGWSGRSGRRPRAHRPELSAARRLLRRLVEVMAGAGRRPGAARPHGPHDRRRHRRRGVLGVRAARRLSRAVRHRRPAPERGAPDPAAARRGPGRPDRRPGRGGQSARGADPSGFRLLRPETGEEIYHSFLGVPMVHGGRAIGVLVVQNRTQRQYSEEEVEALQIVATVFAEMLASGGLVDTTAFPADVGRIGRPERLEGLRLVEGVALGDAVLHQLRIEVTRLVAEDPDAEAARLEEAIAGLRARWTSCCCCPRSPTASTARCSRAYRMFAHDAGWRRRMSEAIRTGLSAEAAVRRVQEKTRLRMSHLRPLPQGAAARPRRARRPAAGPSHRARPCTIRRRCPPSSSWSRARSARPSCSTTIARACAA